MLFVGANFVSHKSHLCWRHRLIIWLRHLYCVTRMRDIHVIFQILIACVYYLCLARLVSSPPIVFFQRERRCNRWLQSISNWYRPEFYVLILRRGPCSQKAGTCLTKWAEQIRRASARQKLISAGGEIRSNNCTWSIVKCSTTIPSPYLKAIAVLLCSTSNDDTWHTYIMLHCIALHCTVLHYYVNSPKAMPLIPSAGNHIVSLRNDKRVI